MLTPYSTPQKIWRWTQFSLSAIGITVALNACSKSSTPASSDSNVALSGKFASAGTSAFQTFDSHLLNGVLGFPGAHSKIVDFSVYTLSCTTSDIPPVTVSGNIDSNGTFNLNVPDGLNKALACNVLDSSNKLIASLIIKDSSKKDMNGNPRVNANPGFATGAVALGNVILNTLTQDATVDAANLSSAALTSNVSITPTDFTGTYLISSIDFTAPKGFIGPCPSGASNCDGPPEGQGIYLNQLTGISSDDGSTVYGLQVWQASEQSSDQSHPKASMDLCGDKTGMAPADLTTAGLSSLAGTGLTSGVFNLTTSIADSNSSYPPSSPTAGHLVNAANVGLPQSAGGYPTATLTGGYKMSTAYSKYQQQACVSKLITLSGGTQSYAYVCGPDTSSTPLYQINLSAGSGCFLHGTTTPAQVDSWPSSCTATTNVATSGATGFTTFGCTGTANVQGTSQIVDCSNISGVFTDANATTPSSAMFNFNSVALLGYQNELCSFIADPLAQAQCYANYYQTYGQNAAGCFPRVDTDWTATTAANFAHVSWRPRNLVIMDKLNFAGSNFATLLTEQHQYQGIQVNGNWVPCSVNEKDGLSITADPNHAGSLIATYISSSTTDSLNSACIAQFGNTVQKYIFRLVKQ